MIFTGLLVRRTTIDDIILKLTYISLYDNKTDDSRIFMYSQARCSMGISME